MTDKAEALEIMHDHLKEAIKWGEVAGVDMSLVKKFERTAESMVFASRVNTMNRDT